MTGIEQLRKLGADAVRGGEVGRAICDIADQIERERACDADTIENLRLELGEARDAIAWVREHGGLDNVKRRWEFLSYYADPVPRSCMERRLARLQRQIDESHAALRRRREVISELNRRACDLTRKNAELRKRAMPEGMCWPVFEDGEPVRIGDVVSDVEVRSVVFRDDGILLSDCTSVPGWGTWRSYKEPIKRPAPKVLDADGVEIREGDTVYQMGCKYRVSHLHGSNGKVRIVYENSGRWVDPKTLTHRAPVLAADGRPLEAGQTAWDTNGDELVIGALEDGGQTVTCRYADVGDAIPVHGMWSPSQLTHTKPEIDTWQRIEEDAGCTATKYNERRGTIFTTKQQVARDLVRRCRALAERERGE